MQELNAFNRIQMVLNQGVDVLEVFYDKIGGFPKLSGAMKCKMKRPHSQLEAWSFYLMLV